MTKHVWLIVGEEGNAVRDFVWESKEEADHWCKSWSITEHGLHVVRATYEWGGKR